MKVGTEVDIVPVGVVLLVAVAVAPVLIACIVPPVVNAVPLVPPVVPGLVGVEDMSC